MDEIIKNIGKRGKRMNRKQLKVWELEKGIKIKTKNRIGKYTEKQFKRLISSNEIVVKTEKGLEYLKNI